MHRLDSRLPLVLDTRDLGRQPGAMEVVRRRVPAPADIAIEVIGVPAGDPIDLDLRLESVVEGVLVTGSVSVVAVGECARCLERVEQSIDVDLLDLYLHHGARPDPGPMHDSTEGESEGLDDLRELDAEGRLDLEPAVRDAVVLALPLAPLCSPGCAGLCVECGARLADDPGHAHEAVDPRWAALAGFADDRGRTIDGRGPASPATQANQASPVSTISTTGPGIEEK